MPSSPLLAFDRPCHTRASTTARYLQCWHARPTPKHAQAWRRAAKAQRHTAPLWRARGAIALGAPRERGSWTLALICSGRPNEGQLTSSPRPTEHWVEEHLRPAHSLCWLPPPTALCGLGDVPARHDTMKRKRGALQEESRASCLLCP